jgi:hypothetical protein
MWDKLIEDLGWLIVGSFKFLVSLLFILEFSLKSQENTALVPLLVKEVSAFHTQI